MDLENLDIINLDAVSEMNLDDTSSNLPSLSLEGENGITGIEAVITNLSLSIIAVLPTVCLAICLPKRLIPLITAKSPISRNGMILGPGVYLLASMFLLVLMLNLSASVAGSLTQQANPDGGGLTSAAAKGSFANFAVTALPVYAVGILLALINFILFRFTGQKWTLRIALAGGFYSVGTILIVGFIPTILLTLFDPTGQWPLGASLTGNIFLFSMVLIPLWHVYHFARAITKVSRLKAIGLCLIYAVLINFLIAMA